MEANSININDYALKLISDKRFCKEEYLRFINNTYSIHNLFGHIDSDILNKLICKARKEKKLRVMLSDILFYVDKKSITDTNFRLLLRFPRRYRATYLSNLGHADLSFYQMQILNRYPLALESFSWLFDKICQCDLFTDEDMLQILKENPDIQSCAIEDCIVLARKKYGPSSKLDVATKWGNNLKATGR